MITELMFFYDSRSLDWKFTNINVEYDISTLLFLQTSRLVIFVHSIDKFCRVFDSIYNIFPISMDSFCSIYAINLDALSYQFPFT